MTIAHLSGATVLTLSNVVDGTGQIVLDNLQCAGTESRLVDCPHNGLNIHNCVHSEDAGVRCLTPISSKGNASPVHDNKYCLNVAIPD